MRIIALKREAFVQVLYSRKRKETVYTRARTSYLSSGGDLVVGEAAGAADSLDLPVLSGHDDHLGADVVADHHLAHLLVAGPGARVELQARLVRRRALIVKGLDKEEPLPVRIGLLEFEG